MATWWSSASTSEPDSTAEHVLGGRARICFAVALQPLTGWRAARTVSRARTAAVRDGTPDRTSEQNAEEGRHAEHRDQEHGSPGRVADAGEDQPQRCPSR